MADPLEPHSASPSELKERLHAEREASALLVYRGENGEQRLFLLAEGTSPVTIGRAPANAICLSWDREVSRVHARLESLANEWTIEDDGLSRNGTFVNEIPTSARRRLQHGDRIQVGSTVLAFRAAGLAESGTTLPSSGSLVPADITPAQRRVLVALCRPYKESGQFAVPAPNHDIAAELHLSIDAVKAHLGALFRRFGIEDLPQNEKRARLTALAFRSGSIQRHEL